MARSMATFKRLKSNFNLSSSRVRLNPNTVFVKKTRFAEQKIASAADIQKLRSNYVTIKNPITTK